MNKASFCLLAGLSGALLALAVPPCEQSSAVQRPSAALAQPGTGSGTVEENVLYGSINGSELRLDVYGAAGPRTETHPAVLLIHGGGWTSLDKSTMRRMGQFLARSGFVAFSIDYRLLQGTENRWPAQLDDAQRAVRWVRANAPKYGVNSERVGAFGHSAGAQLAALLGMEETRDNSDPALAKYSSRVQAVVDVSGPTDFTTAKDAAGLAFLTNLMGTDYSSHPEVWRGASPIYQVSKGDAPFLIVHGTLDENVPIAQAQEFFHRLRSAGVPVSFIKVDDGHTFQTPDARRQLAIETVAFFQRYLIGAG